MYDQDLDPNQPYDNVEFPVRKPGTGTWPGPGGGGGVGGGGGKGISSTGSGVKLYGHQTNRSLGGGPKLAPLVEVDGAENSSSSNGENQQRQQKSGGAFSSSSTTSSTGGSTGGTASSSSSSSSSQVAGKQSGFQNRTQTAGTTGAWTSASSMSSSSSPQNQKGGTTSANTANTTTSSSNTASSATTAATSTTTATTTASSSTAKQNAKPVIPMTNDSSLYMAAEVGDGQRKKKQVETEEEDFKRQDLNPASRKALEKVYTQHSDFYQLNTKVLDEGSLLKQDVLDIYRKTGETLTYEQLLQGMLVDGERFLLGSCWLFYTHVQFLDVEGTKILREPYGRGRIGLTSKRALFLSTETYTDANLEHYGDTNKPSGGYKLEVSKRSAVVFKNIPLSNFHSAEMEVVTGTAAQTKISKEGGCCGCFSVMRPKWVSTPPMTRSIASRVMRLGVSMPPWQTRMFLDVYLDPSMSLTVARDFISQLHAFAPHMH
ncbi:serine-rich adhesin for platelets [Aplysia californica]|uniref:Serine-rich adhesin for platelets n=1 Tax=Aplysia californica TaxID=6500 RepID=A0ABM0JTA5_APLCA|nr:serine-rich adhesin for platelets [Aplysia californica]